MGMKALADGFHVFNWIYATAHQRFLCAVTVPLFSTYDVGFEYECFSVDAWHEQVGL